MSKKQQICTTDLIRIQIMTYRPANLKFEQNGTLLKRINPWKNVYALNVELFCISKYKMTMKNYEGFLNFHRKHISYLQQNGLKNFDTKVCLLFNKLKLCSLM